MSRLQTLMWCAASATAAVALVLSCSDDDHPAIDAARGGDATQCDCPAPPERVDGRLRAATKQDQIPDAANNFTLDITCTENFGVGARAISGGCRELTANVSTFLQSSGGDDGIWGCTWQHPPGSGVITVEAHILCLVPEGTPDAGP